MVAVFVVILSRCRLCCILIALSVCVLSAYTSAQTADRLFTLPKNQLRASIGILSYPKTDITDYTKTHLLRSSRTFSFDLGLSYSRKLTEKYLLNAEVGWGIVPVSLSFDIYRDNPNTDIELVEYRSSQYGIHTIIPSISVQRLFRKNRYSRFSLEAGTSLNIILPYDLSNGMGVSTDTSGSIVFTELFDLEVRSNGLRLRPSIFLKGGILWLSENRN